jgi:hypothetical protein
MGESNNFVTYDLYKLIVLNIQYYHSMLVASSGSLLLNLFQFCLSV